MGTSWVSVKIRGFIARLDHATTLERRVDTTADFLNSELTLMTPDVNGSALMH